MLAAEIASDGETSTSGVEEELPELKFQHAVHSEICS